MVFVTKQQLAAVAKLVEEGDAVPDEAILLTGPDGWFSLADPPILHVTWPGHSYEVEATGKVKVRT